mmetsp:Transcript_15203/g.50526  ORF Transcript_15203/g.50526 Transcript_15203/m.50526 type:complete len:200 (-) Transcript_15203:28-627(-)
MLMLRHMLMLHFVTHVEVAAHREASELALFEVAHLARQRELAAVVLVDSGVEVAQVDVEHRHEGGEGADVCRQLDAVGLEVRLQLGGRRVARGAEQAPRRADEGVRRHSDRVRCNVVHRGGHSPSRNDRRGRSAERDDLRSHAVDERYDAEDAGDPGEDDGEELQELRHEALDVHAGRSLDDGVHGGGPSVLRGAGLIR